jgi:hypothetical protein
MDPLQNPDLLKRLALQQFKAIAVSHSVWAQHAEQYQLAQALLRLPYERAWKAESERRAKEIEAERQLPFEQLRSKTMEGVIIEGDELLQQRILGLFSTILLLQGYALELFLKAIVIPRICREQETVTELPKDLTSGHNLLHLAARIPDFDFSQYGKLLKLLSFYVEPGRYPVTKKAPSRPPPGISRAVIHVSFQQYDELVVALGQYWEQKVTKIVTKAPSFPSVQSFKTPAK